ncbi:hypothetical protein H0H92_011361, partial [Tricholoma furcatifolium]
TQIKFIVAIITGLIIGSWAIPNPNAEGNEIIVRCGYEIEVGGTSKSSYTD